MELLVTLGDRRVGVIRSDRDGQTEFSFLNEYLTSGDRPVLGQYFEDHLTEVHRSRMRLPPFFSNLLPEGGLRELIARRANLHTEREADLIALLGEDLPGAVVVRRISEPDDDEGTQPTPNADDGSVEGALRFSLAGAQLKFSVLYRYGGRGPTLPVDGRGGDWIAKLPSQTYPEVPENEFAMIQWAGRVGISVPDVRLVPVADVDGLPVALAQDQMVFLSRRFDRPGGDRRVHQEDFAQVMNVRRPAHYGTLSYASIARIVRAIAGEDDFDEVIRRITFNVLIGNGDAHLKNWSLVYPEPIRARLSPAYDLVSTITYIPGDKLALKLARENRFDRIELSHFQRLADRAQVAPERVVGIVRETVQRAMGSWPSELSNERSRLLRTHVERLPLVRDAG